MVGSAGGTDAGCTELGFGKGLGAADWGDLSGMGVVWPAPHGIRLQKQGRDLVREAVG